MLFSSNFSNPRSFQQQLSAVQQQPQRTLQRPGVRVSGSTTALHPQHCGQHRNISDGLQTAPTQNHSAVHLCVGINMSMSCSTIGRHRTSASASATSVTATAQLQPCRDSDDKTRKTY
jgi:hypothetical protein